MLTVSYLQSAISRSSDDKIDLLKKAMFYLKEYKF